MDIQKKNPKNDIIDTLFLIVFAVVFILKWTSIIVINNYFYYFIILVFLVMTIRKTFLSNDINRKI